MEICQYCELRPLYLYRGNRHGRIGRTCGDQGCRRLAANARARERRQSNRQARVYECKVCQALIQLPAGTASGPRSLCDQCRTVGHSVAVVKIRRGTESYLCAGCGKSFERAPTKGQRPRWCAACGKGKGWARANRDLRNMADHRRRVRLAAGEVEKFEPTEIYERDRWRCGICKRRVNPKFGPSHPLSASIDHIIPVVEGGHHVRANVRLAHLRCNVSRGARGGGEQLLLIG